MTGDLIEMQFKGLQLGPGGKECHPETHKCHPSVFQRVKMLLNGQCAGLNALRNFFGEAYLWDKDKISRAFQQKVHGVQAQKDYELLLLLGLFSGRIIDFDIKYKKVE